MDKYGQNFKIIPGHEMPSLELLYIDPWGTECWQQPQSGCCVGASRREATEQAKCARL